MNARNWEHFPHDADIGIRGFGDTLAEAFQNAALALTNVITHDTSVEQKQFVFVECSSSDREFLFFEWINAIVYEVSTRRMLFSRFDVKIEGDHLLAKIWGEPVNRVKHKLAVEVKGATLTELSVRQSDSGEWIAQTIVDV